MCCGLADTRFLAIDHVNGKSAGPKESAAVQYRRIARGEAVGGEFQLLCHNCNWAKHAYGACPHLTD